MPCKTLPLDAIPADAPVQIHTSEIGVGNSIKVVGSRTGCPEVLVLLQPDRVVVGRSLDALRRFVIGQGIALQLDPWAVCQFLRNSYVPLPHTVFRDVYLLGIGDNLLVEASADLTRGVRLQNEFAFWASASRGDSPASVERFRREMAAAVERAAGAVSERVLMLSSGLDSAAVALGVADNGFTDVRCLTYSEASGADEAAVAGHLARRLGLRHDTITLSDDATRSAAVLRDFLSNCFLPSGDISFVPYAMCLREAGIATGVCLDGLGELLYGRARKNAERVKLGFNVSAWLGSARAVVPHYSRLSWFVRPRINVYVREYNLDPAHIQRIYKHAVDAESFWADAGQALARRDSIDHIGALRCRYYEHGRAVHKVQVATSAMNLKAGMPWRDQRFGDYFFNLPEEHRYDRRGRVLKPFCRRVLREATGLDNFVSRGFPFDMATFCQTHHDFVRAEILECSLWTGEVEPLLARLYTALRSNYFAAVSILNLFQMSAWMNHNTLSIRH